MSCIHIYFGEQRQGKTLYMVLQAQLAAYDKARLNNCYQRIDAYNELGYHFTKPKHVVVADFDIELHHFGKQPEMNYWCNGFYLGMPKVVMGERKQGCIKQHIEQCICRRACQYFWMKAINISIVVTAK